VGGAFTALVNMYNHDELKFGRDRPYRNTRLGGGWNWTRQGGGGGGFPPAPNVQGDLARAMIANPKLLVQVENGYYDMATPFFPTEFTMQHLGIPAELQKNITLKYYTAGHMMYLQEADRVKLHDNVAAFVDRATK
jgi:carboxypeptidase C (cathepsin A)